MNEPRKLHIKSYGCQMNVYDAQRMVGHAGAGGLCRDRRRRRRRSRHSQHLPHPREGLREGLFRARPAARARRTRPRATAADDDRGRRLRRPGRGRARSSAARRWSISWSDRRAITICRNCWRMREATARAVETEFPVEDKFDFLPPPTPRCDPRARHHGVRHRAGRLRQVLHLLRGALYARRRSLAPGREDRRRRASASPTTACARSP